MNQTSTSSSLTDIPVVVGPSNASENCYSATEAQLEVWLSSQQSVEANCAYNEISSLEFRGSLDTKRIKQALDLSLIHI